MAGYRLGRLNFIQTAGKPISRDRLLAELTAGDADEAAVERYGGCCGLDFPWKTYHVGLVDAGADREAGLRGNVRDLVSEYIHNNFHGFVYDVNGYIGVLFRNKSLLSLPHILRALQENVRSSLGRTVAIALGSPVGSLDMLHKSYSHALRLMEQRFLYGHKGIVIRSEEPGECEAGDWVIQGFDPARLPEDLFYAMDVNNAVAVNNLLEDMKNWQIRHGAAEKDVRASYAELYVSVVGRFAPDYTALKPFFEEMGEVREQIGKKASLQELHGFIKFKLMSVAEGLGRPRPENPIDRILTYMDRNYAREIKLEGLAALFGYNSTYLGRLFKNRTGQYFNTYMDLVRVGKAKQMLREGLKVCEVSEKVGFGDTDYFHKKFKKYTGLPPSAFRHKDA